MSEKPKAKNIVPLPFLIQHAPLAGLVLGWVASSSLFAIAQTFLPTLEDGAGFSIFILLGWLIGWGIRFYYVYRHGDEGQQVQSKAYFFGRIAFLIIGLMSGFAFLSVAMSIIVFMGNSFFDKPNLLFTVTVVVFIALAGWLGLFVGRVAQREVYRIVGYIEPESEK